jgi:hypothetical protein
MGLRHSLNHIKTIDRAQANPAGGLFRATVSDKLLYMVDLF